MNNKKENILGFIVIIASIILAANLKKPALAGRLIIGISFGYALTRTWFGFAGSVNRAYRTGSTRLMRILMLMFVLTAAMNGLLTYFTGVENYKLSTYPINLGLILGGLLFGYGMTFSVCCGSGTLTDLVTGTPRALTTLIFFGLGVFLGYPIQKTHPIVTKSWFESAPGRNGVRFTDIFPNDGLGGYFGAMLITLILAGIVCYISIRYENKRRAKGTYSGVPLEENQETVHPFEAPDFSLKSTYNRYFVKPWSMRAGAVAMSITATGFLLVAKKGWGVTSALGVWFGKVLMFFGVSAESVANFTHVDIKKFTTPFFENGGQISNLGIVIGALIAVLLMGEFISTLKSEGKYSLKMAWQYVMAGFTMGIGTRLANGCNAGALFTPISNFSLSGWLFLVFMVIGGFIGNSLYKRING